MVKKVGLNVLYNIGIFIALFFVYIGIEHHHFFYIAGAVFVGTIFVLLKIKLLKEVKAMQRPVPQPPAAKKTRKTSAK